MIDAARLQVEHLGCEQRSQSNRTWRAYDNFSEFFSLYVIQHLENGREAQFLQLVLRQFKFADRLEVFDRDVANLQLAPGSHDNEFLAGRCSGSGHFADGGDDSINIFEGVGEPGAFTVLQRPWNCASELLKNGAQPFSRGRLAVKTVDVGGKDHQDWQNCAQSLHALNDVAAADMLDEPIEKTKRELLRHHVGHEKRAALRFADIVSLR